jgi:hypothetical protein
MDYNQDQAFNSLRVLDDTYARSVREACAIFGGGIYVDKNIIACKMEATNIESENVKVSDSLAVQNNIYTDGCIVPLNAYSAAQLGSLALKWNNIYSVNTCTDEITSVNANLKNTFIENIYLTANVCDITDPNLTSSTYDIYLESTINIINLTSTYSSDRIVTINIPTAIGSNNDYKKIIFKQNKCIDIKWSYNTNDYIIVSGLDQVHDFINLDGVWKLVNYNMTNHKNTDDISGILIDQKVMDVSLNELYIDMNTLTNYNNFLSGADISANSLLDFIDDTDAIKEDIVVMKASLLNMTTNITSLNINLSTTNTDLLQANSQISDLSLNLNINNATVALFKTVVNTTFQNINTSLLTYDSKICNLNLKMCEMSLDIKKMKEFSDILDKRVCDHIANTDCKMSLMNDKISHINDTLNTILSRLNLC